MGESQAADAGPDLALGVAASELADGAMVSGHVGEDAVLLVRRGAEYFAIGATCTHYSGPLAQGLVVGDTVRCPWHHACFSLRTGEALAAPAFAPVACWATDVRDGRVVVGARRGETPARGRGSSASAPRRIVIIGGGAAGFAAAETLRREGHAGGITMLSNEDAPPVDRPNLSKDYLAGNAPEEWIPLRGDEWYAGQGIELRLNTYAARIDPGAHEVVLDGAGRVAYDRLLIATGAEPVRLTLPGMDLPHVRTLRSLSDSRAIIERAKSARRAVVMGASFIGLEVAASLRARGIDVHVVAPEARPMERLLGREMGDFIRSLHEQHGVVFHLQETAVSVDERQVKLKGGGTIDADLVVAGVGVRPRTQLAEQAGLALDRGVVVDAFLQTSAPDVFAAGDIARWPDARGGGPIRVEHWAVAQRQGQVAARNMLGARERFAAVPFFWSQHYDVPVNYVGHAEAWDELAIDGDIGARDCVLRFKRAGRVLAVASVYRDVESLMAEAEMERESAPA
jgi:NADPH-dependent 2,4-dienoyl-CoA reductase/sulfur reductase-like enzyme/nitrite reductase/ring-hydroxylating ferredoxin subunit